MLALVWLNCCTDLVAFETPFADVSNSINSETVRSHGQQAYMGIYGESGIFWQEDKFMFCSLVLYGTHNV